MSKAYGNLREWVLKSVHYTTSDNGFEDVGKYQSLQKCGALSIYNLLYLKSTVIKLF